MSLLSVILPEEFPFHLGLFPCKSSDREGWLHVGCCLTGFACFKLSRQNKILALSPNTVSLSCSLSLEESKFPRGISYIRVYAGLVLPHFSSPSLVPDTHLHVPTPGSPLPFSCHKYALLLFPLLPLGSREKRHKLPSSVPTVNRPDS